MARQLKYSAEQLKWLRREYSKKRVQDLVQAYNLRFGASKTETAIRSALRNHGIKCGRTGSAKLMPESRIFDARQSVFIRSGYQKHSIRELTARFNKRFGMAATEQQIRSFTRNHGILSGRTGCFQKGNISWNAGTKGVCRPNSGCFQKGSVPPNRRTLGSTRICSKDGFILIKVKERNPHTGAPTRYKHKHVHIWEKTNGKIPAGMVVAFRDGNRLNCKLKNLMLISRAELLRLNQYHYKDSPAQLKPTVLALSKLEVKTFNVSRERMEAAL